MSHNAGGSLFHRGQSVSDSTSTREKERERAIHLAVVVMLPKVCKEKKMTKRRKTSRKVHKGGKEEGKEIMTGSTNGEVTAPHPDAAQGKVNVVGFPASPPQA